MTAEAPCGTCALHNVANLQRLGVDVGRHQYMVALAGNPNTGKSTVFNALTGLRQHVGNWPGTTVARAQGGFRYLEDAYRVIDLPGTYSLLSATSDEDVARDFLLFGAPDVTVVVVDATRLDRNLNLVLQILQITDRVVVALNLMDEVARHGLRLDTRHLTRELGVPIVPLTARSGQGLPELLQAVRRVARGEGAGRGRPLSHRDPEVERAVDRLAEDLAIEFPGLRNTRWVALRLLEGDAGTIRAVQDGRLAALSDAHRTAS